MDIYVRMIKREENEQLVRSLIIRVDLEENESIAIDTDLQDRIAEKVKLILNEESAKGLNKLRGI